MIKKVLVGDEKYKVLIGKNKIFKDYLPSAVSKNNNCLLYTSPSPRDLRKSRMPSSA